MLATWSVQLILLQSLTRDPTRNLPHTLPSPFPLIWDKHPHNASLASLHKLNAVFFKCNHSRVGAQKGKKKNGFPI